MLFKLCRLQLECSAPHSWSSNSTNTYRHHLRPRGTSEVGYRWQSQTRGQRHLISLPLNQSNNHHACHFYILILYYLQTVLRSLTWRSVLVLWLLNHLCTDYHWIKQTKNKGRNKIFIHCTSPLTPPPQHFIYWLRYSENNYMTTLTVLGLETWD